MRALAIIVLVIALAPGVASAQEQAGTSHTVPILPTVKLGAASSGKAAFQVGAGITWASASDIDNTVSLAYETTTHNGFTTLLSATDEGLQTPVDWTLGVGYTLSKLRSFNGLAPEHRAWTNEALRRCLETCTQDPSKEENKEFCQKAKQSGASTLAPEKLDASALESIAGQFSNPSTQYCEAGVEYLKRKEALNRDYRAVIPEWTFSTGFRGSVNNFEVLRPDATDPMRLTTDTYDNQLSGAGALLYTRVFDDFITLEVGGRLQSKSSVGTDKVEWCTATGEVPRGDGTGMTDTAEVCQERALGPPGRSRTMDGMFLVGRLDSTKTSRSSAGLFVSINHQDQAGDTITYGFKLPILLSTDVLPGEEVYKGLLRLTPALGFTRTSDDETTMRFSVSLEVLTSRSLFGTALDAF